MFERIGRVPVPPWFNFVIIGSVVAVFGMMAAILRPPSLPDIHVAFIGNSMMYYK